MLVVSRVARIHLGRSMTSKQRPESLIDQGCVLSPCPHAAGTAQQLGVDCCAQAYAIHATIMPRTGAAGGSRLRAYRRKSLPVAGKHRRNRQDRPKSSETPQLLGAIQLPILKPLPA